MMGDKGKEGRGGWEGTVWGVGLYNFDIAQSISTSLHVYCHDI